MLNGSGIDLQTGAAGLLSRLIGRGIDTGEPLPIVLRRQYGDNILTFGEGTWQDALAAAAQIRRPLLLYIHSPEHIVRFQNFRSYFVGLCGIQCGMVPATSRPAWSIRPHLAHPTCIPRPISLSSEVASIDNAGGCTRMCLCSPCLHHPHHPGSQLPCCPG